MFLKICTVFVVFIVTNSVKSTEVEYLEAIEIFKTYNILESLQEFSETTKCGDALLEYLHGLNKTEMWALTMFDSSAKVPDGLLAGNFKFLGHFDECVGVEHPDGIFTGEHCMLDVKIDIPGNRTYVSMKRPFQPVAMAQNIQMALWYAVCLPSSCSPLEINLALNGIFNKSKIIDVSLDKNNCRTKEPIPWTDGDWAVLGILIAFIVVAFSSTVYDIFQRFYQKNEKPHPLLASFSVYANGHQLFHISEAGGQLKCLHGLRFFSMCWVVLSHSFGLGVAGPVVNAFEVLKMVQDVNHTVIVNGYVSVDSFFFLSGLLVCFVFFRDISKKKYYDVPLAYIHRYIRLTPAFGMVILIQVTLFLRMGDGPYWHYFSDMAAAPCRESWWSGLLYIQNFANPDSQCLGQSWYLSTDMQLYWLSPLVLYPILFFPMMTPIFLLLLILTVTFTDFALAYVHKLGPSSFFTTNTDQEVIEYIHFYTRAVPWLTGVGVAYLICGIQAKKVEIKLTKFWVLIGWLTSTGLCLGALYGIVPFTDYEWTDLEAAFYLSFHRVGWSLGLAWIVFACVQGYGGVVNSFLSWGIFQPLGKLSYCTFLVHEYCLFFRGGSMRTNVYAGNLELTYFYLGDVVLSYLLAIPFSLLFEMPFGNLDRYLFQNVTILPFPRPKNKVETGSSKNQMDIERNNDGINNLESVVSKEKDEHFSKPVD